MEHQQTQITEYNPIAQALATLREQYEGATFDVATTDGMEQAKKARNELRGYRTRLEDVRKRIKAPALERCRLIDAEAKDITAQLVALEDPIATQVTAQEKKADEERQRRIKAEQERVAAISKRVDAIGSMVVAAVTMDSTQIRKTIDDLKAIDFVEFAEFADGARAQVELTVAKLTEMLEAKQRAEEEATRIRQQQEVLRRQQEELAQQQAEQRLLQEENARKEAELKAQREALAALKTEAATSSGPDAHIGSAAQASPPLAAPSTEGATTPEVADPLPTAPIHQQPMPEKPGRQRIESAPETMSPLDALQRIYEICTDDGLDSYTVRRRVEAIAVQYVEWLAA